jgi:hypothetical protein
MSDSTNTLSASTDEGGSHWLRWIILIAIALGGVAAARSWALSKADAEFEQRLRLADEQRI